MKITQKVSFIVYNLSGQKFLKNAKNGPFWRIFEQPEAYCQVVLPDRSILIGPKIGGKCQNVKIEMRHFK